MQRATADPLYHSTLVGTAPAKHTIEVRKTFMTATSPVVQPNGTVGDPILFEDTLAYRYDSDGGRFTFAVTPSTRPVVAGRDGRDPTGPPQDATTLTNPEGTPAENRQLSQNGPFEETSFTVLGPEDGIDNGYADLEFSWGSGNVADWDFYLYGPDGEEVASAATGNQPETMTLRDPVPGEYRLVVFNYDGGADDDWSGTVTYRNPTPAVVNDREAWTLTCTDKNGRVKAVRDVVVDRGETVDLKNVCSQESRAGR